MSVVVYVLGLVVAVLLGAVGELVSDEIRARLDRIPLGILTMASKRLPPEQRKTIYAEAWLPELRYILQGDEATPDNTTHPWDPIRGEPMPLSS